MICFGRRALRKDDIDRARPPQGAAPVDPRGRLLRVERAADRPRAAKPLALGELFGWYVIADQYWQRYRRPMMHTETNKMDADGAPRWLWRQWHNVQLLANSGVPLVGFTWYSLTDQIDWSIAMSEAIGIVYPVGLFDLNREPRIVGLAYKHLIDTLSRPARLSRMPGAQGDHAMMTSFLIRARLRSRAEPAAAACRRDLGSARDGSGDRRALRVRLARGRSEILGAVAAC